MITKIHLAEILCDCKASKEGRGFMPQDYDEDIEDIMSSIMQNQVSKSTGELKSASLPPKKTFSLPETPVNSVAKKVERSSPVQKRTSPQKKRRTVYIAGLGLLILFLVGGSYFVREPLLSLFEPSNPLGDKISDQLAFKPYYPSKLPGSFKIETNSLSQELQNNIVLYVISDDGGKSLAINQQLQPAGLDLSGVFARLQEVRTITTPVGEATSGLDPETNKIITHLPTGNVWIIITMNNGVMDDASLDLMLHNIKQA